MHRSRKVKAIVTTSASSPYRRLGCADIALWSQEAAWPFIAPTSSPASMRSILSDAGHGRYRIGLSDRRIVALYLPRRAVGAPLTSEWNRRPLGGPIFLSNIRGS